MTDLVKNSKDKNLCICGCGQLCNNKYKQGHNSKTYHKSKYDRIKPRNYWYIWKPDHPFVNKNNRIPEHRYIYEKYHNCCLLKYVDIHHKDSNKENNSIENLEPIYHNKHTSINMIGNQYRKKNMSDRYCLLCGSNTTYINKNNNPMWYNYKDGYVCKRCYRNQYWKKYKI